MALNLSSIFTVLHIQVSSLKEKTSPENLLFGDTNCEDLYKCFLLNELQPRLVFFPLKAFYHFDARHKEAAAISSILCKFLLIYPGTCQHFRIFFHD